MYCLRLSKTLATAVPGRGCCTDMVEWIAKGFCTVVRKESSIYARRVGRPIGVVRAGVGVLA